MALYDHDRKRQRLYFHNVDKANPQRNTLEYVSMCLRQRYVVRNALRWLHIEESTAMYKRMEDFMKIDITRFGSMTHWWLWINWARGLSSAIGVLHYMFEF